MCFERAQGRAQNAESEQEGLSHFLREPQLPKNNRKNNPNNNRSPNRSTQYADAPPWRLHAPANIARRCQGFRRRVLLSPHGQNAGAPRKLTA